MTRIRVELDVPEDRADEVLGWDGATDAGLVIVNRGPAVRNFGGTRKPGITVRSVEIVEPVRRTVLTLETDVMDSGAQYAADEVLHFYGSVNVPWKVTSCVSVEDYPT